MDVAAPIRPENLRPFVSIVVPGLISTLPFTILLGHYVTDVKDFWNQHPTAFGLLLSAIILAAGFVMGELGERFELCWDKRLLKLNAQHEEEWHAYLRLELNDEVIGQRFLRNKLTQFKFELAMVPSLLVFQAGMWWLQLVVDLWSTLGFILFSVAVFALAGYLLFESWSSADALAETRRQILEACRGRGVQVPPTGENPPVSAP